MRGGPKIRICVLESGHDHVRSGHEPNTTMYDQDMESDLSPRVRTRHDPNTTMYDQDMVPVGNDQMRSKGHESDQIVFDSPNSTHDGLGNEYNFIAFEQSTLPRYIYEINYYHVIPC